MYEVYKTNQIQHVFNSDASREKWPCYMWCDLGKSVWSRTCNIFSFLFDWSAHLERYMLLKTHLNRTSGSKVMSNWNILKTIANKKKKIPFSGYISQSMLLTFDWFRQITTHICCVVNTKIHKTVMQYPVHYIVSALIFCRVHVAAVIL